MHPTLYLLRMLSVLCLPSDLAHSEGKLEVSRNNTSKSSLSFGPPLRRVLNFSRVPWQDLVLWSIEVNCLVLRPSSSFCFIFPSLTGFPGIFFQINYFRLEWNKGIVGHVAAFGEPLNIKDAYEVNELLEHRQGIRLLLTLNPG